MGNTYFANNFATLSTSDHIYFKFAYQTHLVKTLINSLGFFNPRLPQEK